MKKRIIVFNLPAQELGALNILRNSYKKAIDDNNEYLFVISGDYLKSADNVKVISFPWIKKSWFHRMFFDVFMPRKIIEKYNADEIISYHNMTINSKKTINQTVYLHNAIPFSDVKFSIMKETKLWIYKNIMNKLIFNSLKKADKIIVQSNWIKGRILNSIDGIEEQNIMVEKTDVSLTRLLNKQELYKENNLKDIYIYPAASFTYKNHNMIIEACKKLTDEKRKKINILFTISEFDNAHSMNIKKNIDKFNLPITLIGKITPHEVQEYYLSHKLLFSSKLETLGLPLLEAQLFKTPIVCLETDLNKEVTNSYKMTKYFRNSDDLSYIFSGK